MILETESPWAGFIGEEELGGVLASYVPRTSGYKPFNRLSQLMAVRKSFSPALEETWSKMSEQNGLHYQIEMTVKPGRN